MSVIIGLTGGIGSGKSTIAKVFANLGVPVFNADAAAKQIMNTSTVIKEKLMETFGSDVYMKGAEGEEVLNRVQLAKIVFSNSYQLELLNSIVHPVTIQAAFNWAAAQTTPYVIKEAALFFESGSSFDAHKMIGVSAPKAVRINRVMKRDACTKEEVERRMSNQIDESLKMKLCDWVIVNDDQQLVLPQVVSLHEQILLTL
jgi:dephospho-CoA kinase